MDLQKLRLVCKIATQFSRWLLNPNLEASLLSYSEAIKHVEYVQQATIILRFGNNKDRRNNPPRRCSSCQGNMAEHPMVIQC